MFDYPLAFVAGVLTLLSPCVLPILPVVLAGAVQTRRSGLYLLAGGLMLSFVVSGLVLNALGPSLGLAYDSWQKIGAVLMTAMGIVLLVPMLDRGMARLTQPLSNRAGALANQAEQNLTPGSIVLPLVTGLSLGAIWLPCSGPSLGAAMGLAAKQIDLFRAGIVMAIFSLGAILPLLLIATGGRRLIERRGQMLGWASRLKRVLGLVLVVVGIASLTGLSQALESRLVDWSPDWLTDLTTRL